MISVILIVATLSLGTHLVRNAFKLEKEIREYGN